MSAAVSDPRLNSDAGQDVLAAKGITVARLLGCRVSGFAGVSAAQGANASSQNTATTV
jgi:hypothetical protein